MNFPLVYQHLDEHVGASEPIAGGTRLCDHTDRTRHLLKAYKDFCLFVEVREDIV